MSLMKVSCEQVGSLNLKVEGFRTPLTGNITSAQTKTMLQHFPIKSTQQSFQFDVITSSWAEMKALQDFVRGHQIKAMAGTTQHPEVLLWWPERGINNWSGFIEKMPAGDKRFNIAPRCTVDMFLVDSLLSEKTYGSSLASDFKSMFGNNIGAGAGNEGWWGSSPADGITPPTNNPAINNIIPGTGAHPRPSDPNSPIPGGLIP